ncbi:glycosyltransferase family 39 protein [Micromonospora sp. CPCC 206060]|uniref:glycosyltransferase family 39 protein n=1 Tax=Micromonospora sp. CPCC 206060 TaxID=3122406 RepID=UPI002FF32BE9
MGLSRYGWIWPVLTALAVTGYRLTGAQPWRDELATWSAAGRDVDDLFRMAGTIDAVNAPYYLFMHGWTAVFGDSVAALRAPAVLATAAAAGLVAVLGRLLFSARTGLVAGLFYAVVPSTSRYAQEARSYALATAFALLASVLLVRALRRPTPARWLGYALAVTVLGLTHLVALTLLAGHAAGVLAAGRGRRDRWWGWLLAVVPAVLALTPLVVLGRGQQGRQLDWVDPPTPGDLAALPGVLAQSGQVGGLLLGLATLGAVSRGRRGLAVAGCVLLPTVLLLVAGLATPLWVPRYLTFTVPFGCLLAAVAPGTLRLRAALLVVAVTALLGVPEQLALRRTHEWPRTAPVDYAGAARIIADGQRPGDAVVYSPRDGWRFLDLAMAYHLRGRPQPRDALLVRDQAARGDLWVDECADPAPCLAGHDRVWLLVAGTPADPPGAVTGARGAALRTGYRTERSWRVPGLTVALLTRR